MASLLFFTTKKIFFQLCLNSSNNTGRFTSRGISPNMATDELILQQLLRNFLLKLAQHFSFKFAECPPPAPPPSAAPPPPSSSPRLIPNNLNNDANNLSNMNNVANNANENNNENNSNSYSQSAAVGQNSARSKTLLKEITRKVRNLFMGRSMSVYRYMCG